MTRWTYATAKNANGSKKPGTFDVLADGFKMGQVMRVSTAESTVVQWRAIDGQHGHLPIKLGVEEGCRRVRTAVIDYPHFAGLNWQDKRPGD